MTYDWEYPYSGDVDTVLEQRRVASDEQHLRILSLLDKPREGGLPMDECDYDLNQVQPLVDADLVALNDDSITLTRAGQRTLRRLQQELVDHPDTAVETPDLLRDDCGEVSEKIERFSWS